MKVIPAWNEHAATASEKLVYRAMESVDLGSNSICFYSQKLLDHPTKQMGEIDFVVLDRRAIIVLEVKGGNVLCDNDGRWWIEEGRRRRPLYESPWNQARENMFALRRRIAQGISGDWDLRRVCFGYAVVFPFSEFELPEGLGTAPDCDPSILLDGSLGALTPNRMQGFLNNLLRAWRLRDRDAADIPEPLLQVLRQFLRPFYQRVESVSNLVRVAEVARHECLGEQSLALDMIDSHTRIAIEGPAGTGKTLLAFEAARLLAQKSEFRRVCFVCESPTLAAFLRSRARSEFAVLCLRDLQRQLDAGSCEPYDALVVDEGQDLLDYAKLDVLDRAVANGLEGGWWRFFLDPNAQSHLASSFDPEALSQIRSMGAVVRLRRNYRNTKPIVERIQELTEADLGVSAIGDGPKTRVHWLQASEDAAEALHCLLQDWLDHGVELGDIAILSAVSFEHSCVARLPMRWRERIRGLTEATAAALPIDRILFSDAIGFKGLESRYVAVVDFGSLDSDRVVAAVYVGMSRARAMLYIQLPMAQQAELSERSRKVRLSRHDQLPGSIDVFEW